MEYDAHVWHDHTGRIIAWGHAKQGAVTFNAEPLAKPGQGVITARLSEEDLSNLNETYHVDPVSARLLKRK